ncbi:MAG: hypothetical protein ABL921_04240 [Pirellula sp.]
MHRVVIGSFCSSVRPKVSGRLIAVLGLADRCYAYQADKMLYCNDTLNSLEKRSANHAVLFRKRLSLLSETDAVGAAAL